jgi:hypothetical protein
MDIYSIQPPEIIDSGDRPIIFLAGPIQNGPNWQARATKIINDLSSEILVANPRREYLDGEFVYEAQVDWETHYLHKAGKNGVVLFWLAVQETPSPERPYAQTTRFEIGEWKTRAELLKEKVVVGFEEGFSNSRYIRRRFSQDAGWVPLLSSLEETCQAAVTLALETQ